MKISILSLVLPLRYIVSNGVCNCFLFIPIEMFTAVIMVILVLIFIPVDMVIIIIIVLFRV